MKSANPWTALDGDLSEYEILKGALGLSVETLSVETLKARIAGWGTVRIDSEVADAMERVALRNKPRKTLREVS
jgi:hypothetical protein